MAESSAEPRVIVIDGDGDTVLTLKGPAHELKNCECDSDTGTDTDNDTDNDTDTDSGTDSGAYSDSDSISCPGFEVKPAAEAEQVPVTQYHVSSMWLKQASKYFRNMFSGGFSETLPSPADGKYHITAEGFQPFAFEKVLNIIHHKDLGLQNKIGQEDLAYIAVIVDYYDMYEAVSSQTKIWGSEIAKDSFLKKCCFDTFIRAFVLKIFGEHKDFEDAAKYIVQTSKGPIPDVGISTLGVSELLDDHRLRAIQALVDKIKEVARPNSKEYWSHTVFTRDMIDECDSISASGQRIHEIEPPYWGVSYKDLVWQVSKHIDTPPDRFSTLGLPEYEAIRLHELWEAWLEKEYRPQDLLYKGICDAAPIAWDCTEGDENIAARPNILEDREPTKMEEPWFMDWHGYM